MQKFIDLTGQRFGRLVVVGGHCVNGRRYSNAICDCGVSKSIRNDGLTSGVVLSCGCLGRESRKRSNTKHGCTTHSSASAEYQVWCGMKQRCNNPNAINYHNYGGRGIYYCERWELFENFIEDMGVRPSDSHSIDRINNDGPYSPENCRWVTKSENLRNTRRNSYFEYNGELLTLSQIVRKTGLPKTSLRNRILVLGESVAVAVAWISSPDGRRGKYDREKCGKGASIISLEG